MNSSPSQNRPWPTTDGETPESLFAWQLINVHTRYISNASGSCRPAETGASSTNISLSRKMQINHSRNPQNRQVGGSTSGRPRRSNRDPHQRGHCLRAGNHDPGFLPTETTARQNNSRYQTDHGRAAVFVQAGFLVKPEHLCDGPPYHH